MTAEDGKELRSKASARIWEWWKKGEVGRSGVSLQLNFILIKCTSCPKGDIVIHSH